MSEFVAPSEPASAVTTTSAAGTGAAAADQAPRKKMPVVVLVIGMAGSGKTTVMHRINLHMNERGLKGYFVNLDPAVRTVPFSANIDIRDTVDYKEVMKQYGLGPNGAILTSLNLFATRFDQVIGILEKRSDNVDYIFIDTPGQIEVFTWSAGGQIIHELLASSFPTVVMYVSDTPRCASPTTFMSNMLYSCSILYKSKLPMVCAFNKTDVVGCEFATEWMNDFEAFNDALEADRKEEYMTSFNRSLSLVMDEFYKNIRRCGISAVSGSGFDALFAALDASGEEFYTDYYPDLQRRKASREALQQEKAEANAAIEMSKLMKDLRPDGVQVPDGPPVNDNSSSSNDSNRSDV